MKKTTETDRRVLVDTLLVPHTAFEESQSSMEQCYAYARAGAHEPVCLALIGESRTGKSRAIEAFRRKYPTQRLADGLETRILVLNVPSKPTVKAMAEQGLYQLGAPDWERGTENAKTTRLAALMRACGVVMLILDEFHHFYDKSSHRVQHHVADWLKILVSATRVAMVVSGLPSLQAVIDQNEQLAGRFLSPVRMPRFDWLVKAQREEWLAILEAFTEGLGAYFDLPQLGGDELGLRMYCATGGLIGYLTKTLRQAIWNAIDGGTKTITLAALARAHHAAVWSRVSAEGLPAPFDKKWDAILTVDLAARTRLVGTAPAAPPLGKKAAARAQSAAEVLTAR